MYGAVEVDTSAALADACELLHSLHDRCTRREAVRPDETADDHEWTRSEHGVYVLPVREGFLLRYPQGSKWTLTMRWNGDYGERVLCCGTLADIERLAREIQRYGPLGGPAYGGGPRQWQRFDDATWHVATPEGELRLMPAKNGEHLLLNVRNDRAGSFAVVGMGEPDELQDAIDAASNEFEHVRISIGGRPRFFRCVGAGHVLGILENGDDRFVLGHVGGELFQLVCQTGAEIRYVRAYALDEVQRGDLGRVMEWAHEELPPKPSAPAQVHPPAEVVRRASGTSKPSETSPPELRGLELQHVLAHLTPEAPPTGAASTIIPLIYAGLRILVRRGRGNWLLWAHQVQDLLNECSKSIQIHCCAKIMNLALRAVAEHTPLLVRRGRRWLLRLGELKNPNSAILQSIVRMTTLLDDVGSATVEPSSTRPSPSPPSQVHPRPQPAPATSLPTRPGELNAAGPVERRTTAMPASSTAPSEGAPKPSTLGVEPSQQTPPPLDNTRESAVPAGPTGTLSGLPQAVASGLPRWAETRETFREWLDENMERAMQGHRNSRRTPSAHETGVLFSESRTERGPIRWTRFRRRKPP